MPEKQTKDHMITVRVSADEYQAMRAVSASGGYRNVSELARAAMRSVIADQLPPHELLALRVNEQAARIASLTREVERLRSLAWPSSQKT